MKRIYGTTDAISRLRAALDAAEEELLNVAYTIPPPGATSFDVTGTDVALAAGAMRETPFGDLKAAARAALEMYAYLLAERAAVGGPEVTEEDVAETGDLIKNFDNRAGRTLTRMLLEHDRARVAARTAGQPLDPTPAATEETTTP